LVDEAFVREAVDQAELNALRMALFQATGNPEVGAIPLERVVVRGGAGTMGAVPEAYRQRLKDLAVAYLLDGAADHQFTVPSEDEIDRLLEMVEGQPLPERDVPMRRRLLWFEDYPNQASWTADRPPLPEGFHVLIVGAGMSGIAMGVQLGGLGIPYTLVEKRHEVGGVWSTNTYPDARVDTLTATYQFTFEKGYPWSEYFAKQPEVRGYLDHVARKHGVHEHVQFGQEVTSARFDEASNTWAVTVVDRESGGQEQVLHPNVVVSAAGLFAQPRDITTPGASDFEGELLHTTEWGPEHSAAGKRVAVIGNGSTGVQLLGRVAEAAEQVHVFQRSPQWIAPRERYGEVITDAGRWLLDAMPYYWNWSRYVAVIPLFDAYELLVPDPEWQAQGGHINARSDGVREGLTAYIKDQVGGRQDLIDKLVPDYAPIARRPVVDNGWYRALTRDNVELVTTPIERITPHGIRTADGTERELDMIIAAIGFQASRYLWPTEYTGTGGVTLDDLWTEKGAKAYVGITVPHFPNFFMLYGPNSQPVAGGATLPTWFEMWSRYIADGIVAMLERGCSRIELRREVYEEYNDRLDEVASGLIYLTDAGSRDINYYVNEHGRLQINVPWEADEYYRLSAFLDLEHYTLS
jgi:4-hydroxyacetophenone monooxygenase